MSEPLGPPATDAAQLHTERQKALRALEAHLEDYRAKARSHPEPLLMSTYSVESLLYYCRRLIELGCPVDVPRATQGMALVEGALGGRYPDRYSWHFSKHLIALSHLLGTKACPEEALTVMQHAVEMDRELARHSQGATLLHLPGSLAALATLWRTRGRPEEALKAMEEAVGCYRRHGALAGNDPLRTFEQGFAKSLAGLGSVLRELDRPQEALRALKEAAALPTYGLTELLLRDLEPLSPVLRERGCAREAEEVSELVLKLREKLRQLAAALEEEEALRRAGVPQWVR